MVIVMADLFPWVKVSKETFLENWAQVSTNECLSVAWESVPMDDAEAIMWSVSSWCSHMLPTFCELHEVGYNGRPKVTYWIHDQNLSQLAFDVEIEKRLSGGVVVAAF